MPRGAPSSNYPDRTDETVTSHERRELDEVFSLVYEELRRLASSVRRNDPSMTMNSTALVHEAWLKLKDSPHLADTSVPHFKAIAARAMRQVLVDAARRRIAHKRGGSGEAIFVALDESAGQTASCDAELIGLDIALEGLSKMNLRQARVVECRFFGGLNVDEAASFLGVSESVIERDWRAAKAWLACALRPAAEF
jgi:RNA polymerase sigma factor (TIGR02999 family)